MKEQIDKAIQYFENEIEQYEMILKGAISNNYRKHIRNVISYYKVAVYVLNEISR